MKRMIPMLLILGALAAGAPAARTEPRWPDTPLAARVRAWFTQLRGDEAAARVFFQEHLAPSALKEVPIEARLERRRSMLGRVGPLEPLEVVSHTASTMTVRAREPDGEEPFALFEAEAAPPHRLLGVRIEMGGPGGGPPPGPALPQAEALKQVRALLDERAKAGAFSGAVLVARGGRVPLRDAWGLADRAAKKPITPETRFNMASIGKIPTLVALAQLAEQGKLSLDDRLSKYLPDFPRAADITLEMLAQHRSGVGDFFGPHFESLDRSKLRHNRDYLPLFRDQPLWFEPGTARRYSNGGFVLLGEVIAKASGMDYYDYLAKRVYAPAGMKATAGLIEGDGTPNVARGYTREGAPAGSEVDNVGTRPWRGSAAGGGYTTVDDLLALDRALVGGRLAGRGWSDWIQGGPRPDRGATSKGLVEPGFGFAGGAPGISTEWTREGDVTLIVLTNRDPEVTQPVVEQLRGLVMRMQP